MAVDPSAATDTAESAIDLGDAPFEQLLTEVIDRVRVARDEQVRWRLLLEAVVTMAADLSLDELLARIVRIGADLAGAAYAALGVLGSGSERRLRTFITYGLTEEQTARIGSLPSGHGLLGLIIDHPEPLRLHDIAARPESYGFPPEHPPMHSFLGVPVRTRDKVFGNLYLTEKVGGGDFTAQDENIVVALAAAAGVAIENATLHEEAMRRERWLAASAEITRELMTETEGSGALQLVADLAREVSGADVAWIVAGSTVDDLRGEVVAGADLDPQLLRSVVISESIASTAVGSGGPVYVENLAAEAAVDGAALSALGPAVMVPLPDSDAVSEVSTEGVLALAWRHERADEARAMDLAMPTTFAEQAGLAIRIARSRRDRERLAVYSDRDRIGRDLHDLVIQRLFAIGLNLQGALRWTDNPDLAGRLDSAVEEIDDTIRDIRRTIFELGALEQAGDLQSQVTALVNRAAGSLKVRPSLSFEGPVRLRVGDRMVPDVLAVLTEALSNASRHAQASEVAVSVRVDDELTVRVRDDGRGIPDNAVESGLVNMRERAERLGGRCVVRPVEPRGTLVEWSVPLT